VCSRTALVRLLTQCSKREYGVDLHSVLYRIQIAKPPTEYMTSPRYMGVITRKVGTKYPLHTEELLCM
jgi:hypothetical protein